MLNIQWVLCISLREDSNGIINGISFLCSFLRDYINISAEDITERKNSAQYFFIFCFIYGQDFVSTMLLDLSS